ncbi:MAG: helix-turn-helix domain-containing protein [Candidatus Hydrogenedentes bacterium]|nr:helix-turn-helix domain-containing protein [Candidatus Hydrogenedentota bacterium]
MNTKLISETEACRYLGCSRSFLARGRMEGRREGRTPGPPYVKIGRAVRYDLADLDTWVAEHKRQIR